MWEGSTELTPCEPRLFAISSRHHLGPAEDTFEEGDSLCAPHSWLPPTVAPTTARAAPALSAAALFAPAPAPPSGPGLAALSKLAPRHPRQNLLGLQALGFHCPLLLLPPREGRMQIQPLVPPGDYVQLLLRVLEVK